MVLLLLLQDLLFYTASVGVNYWGDILASTQCQLPASAGLSVGESIIVKAGSNCGVSKTIKINCAGSQKIDGVTKITLESPFAAVELVYTVADTFRIV